MVSLSTRELSRSSPAPAAPSKRKARSAAKLLHLVGTCAHPAAQCRRWAGCAWLLPGNPLRERLSPCAYAAISVSAQHSCPWAQMARPGGDSGGKSPQCLPWTSLYLCPSGWILGCRSPWKRSRGFSHVCLGARSSFGSNLLYTASSSPSFCPAPPRSPWPHLSIQRSPGRMGRLCHSSEETDAQSLW